MVNVDASMCEKDCIWNPATCSCENGKYLASIIDNSVIMCDEIIEETKTIPTNLNEKNVLCKRKSFCILLTFLLITIALLIAVTISFCQIKYKAKQKHLLLCYITNGKLINVLLIMIVMMN